MSDILQQEPAGSRLNLSGRQKQGQRIPHLRFIVGYVIPQREAFILRV